MVGVGGISILQLLQGVNDLVEARENFHYFDIQIWLPSEIHGHYRRLLAPA